MRVGSALATHLFGQFSAETRALFLNYGGGADDELTRALVKDLNAVVCGPPLYTDERFDKVRLSAETRELLERAPQGDELKQLNWLLLQDAYPSELAQRKEISG